MVGNPISCEILATKKLARRYRIDAYLCLSEIQPFEIYFEFYKPYDSWRLQTFSYETKIDEMIKKSLTDEIKSKL
jgi:hypothetical protein